MRDFLMTTDMSPDELVAVVDLAMAVKQDPESAAGRLGGDRLGRRRADEVAIRGDTLLW